MNTSRFPTPTVPALVTRLKMKWPGHSTGGRTGGWWRRFGGAFRRGTVPEDRGEPRLVEEASRASPVETGDGCGGKTSSGHIGLPARLSVPGVLSAGIFCFTLCWNEFLYALLIISSGDMKTIPVGVVSDLIKADVLFWGSLMAAAVLGSLPLAVLYSFFVKYSVSRLIAGAGKAALGWTVPIWIPARGIMR